MDNTDFDYFNIENSIEQECFDNYLLTEEEKTQEFLECEALYKDGDWC